MDPNARTKAGFVVDEIELGPLDIPELAAIGIEVELIDTPDMPASMFAGVAVRTNLRGLHVRLLGPTGNILGGTTRRIDGHDVWLATAEISQIVVEIPPAALALADALADPDGVAERDPVCQRPSPDWDIIAGTIDRIGEHMATAESLLFGDDRRERIPAALRKVATGRRDTWPERFTRDPFHPTTKSALEERWGPLALCDIVDALPPPPGGEIEPFVPAVRASPVPGVGLDELALGVSHFNGYPHVPADFEWPTWDCPGYEPGPGHFMGGFDWSPPAGEGPLTFVSQFNLAEVPLPPTWVGPLDGWLLFFVDHDRHELSDRAAAHQPGAHRVIHLAAGTELELLIAPWDDPHYGRWGWKDAEGTAMDYIGYGKPAWVYFEPLNVANVVELELAYLRGHLENDPAATERLNQAIYGASSELSWLAGAPHPAQDDPLGEALLFGEGHSVDELGGVRGEWTQLFQIASETRLDMVWGDVGLLHVFIRTADLEAGRFDRTLLTFQCS